MIDQHDVITAIIDGLETETGRTFGDQIAPDDVTPTYGLLRTIPGGGPDTSSVATLDHGGTRDVISFQLTYVGNDPQGARWLQNKSREALRDLSNFTAPSGTVIAHITLDLPGGEPRDEDLGTEPLFYTHDRYRMMVVPT